MYASDNHQTGVMYASDGALEGKDMEHGVQEKHGASFTLSIYLLKRTTLTTTTFPTSSFYKSHQ